MATRVGGADIRLEFGNVARAGSLTVAMHWTSMPFYRAREKFDSIWSWLELCGRANWLRVDSLAAYFHPDYIRDPATGVLELERAKGSPVFLAMERMEYNRALVEALAPTIAARIPRKSRGVPVEFLEATLDVAATLACHEFHLLQEAIKIKGDQHDGEAVARHLYWFERFAALWARTAADKPNNVALTDKKREGARAWQAELTKHVKAYRATHPEAKLRSAVAANFKGRELDPKFDRAYRWALKNLRK